MTVLYVAGPMTGLPDHNYPAFFAAEASLREAGYEVLNPARNPGPEWVDYMRQGLRDVLVSDGLALLPGWLTSKGARLEVRVALDLDLPCQPLGEWLPWVP